MAGQYYRKHMESQFAELVAMEEVQAEDWKEKLYVQTSKAVTVQALALMDIAEALEALTKARREG